MKFSVAEILVLVIGITVVAPVLSALLTPSPDAVTMILLWLVVTAVFVSGFIAARWLLRKKP